MTSSSGPGRAPGPTATAPRSSRSGPPQSTARARTSHAGLGEWLWLENAADQEDFNLSYGFHLPPRLAMQETAEPLDGESEAVKSSADHGFVDSVYYSGAVSTPYVDAVGNIVEDGADATTEHRCCGGSRPGGTRQAPEPLTGGPA